MSDSGGANGNSWTILAPEVKESAVESVGPLAEGQEGSDHSEPAQLETELPDPKHLSQISEFTDGPADHNNGPEAPQVTPLETTDDAAVLHASHSKDSTLSATAAESLTCLSSDPEQQSASRSESKPLPHHDTDSFSDSYAQISQSPEFTLHHAASQDEDGISPELRKTLNEESKQDVEVLEEKGSEDDGVRRRKVSLLTPVGHQDDEEEEEAEEEPFHPPQREDIGFSLNKCIFGAVILLGLGTIFFSEGDADENGLKDPNLQKEWLNPEAQKDTSAGVQPPEILERLAKESQQIAILQAQLKEQEGELKAAQMRVEEGTKERMKREELEMENQRIRGELNKLPALQELEQENKRVKKESESVKKDLEALPGLQKELELLRAKVTEFTLSTDSAQTDTGSSHASPSMSPSAGHDREVLGSHGRKEQKDKKLHEKVRGGKEQKEGKEWKKDRGVKDGKQWKENEGEGRDLKKQKDWEKKVHKDEGNELTKDRSVKDGKQWKENEGEGRDLKKQKDWEKKVHKDDGNKWTKDRSVKDGKQWKENKGEGKDLKQKEWEKKVNKDESKEWRGKGERKERKDEQDVKKGKKQDDGKTWKDGERKRGSKEEESLKREWREEGKRWKDGEVRREFKDEDVKMEWKEDKKEKHWKLDGERWETKESKHLKDKVKEEKEWKPRGDQKDGKVEREWKKVKHVDSNDKDYKEGNERKKEWKERNEWDGEKERKIPKGAAKAWKESAWKGEKDDHKRSGGKKERKESEDKHWSGKEKEQSKDGERSDRWKEDKKHKGDYQRTGEKWSKKDRHEQDPSDKQSHHFNSNQKDSKDHMHGNYWTEQRERIHHYRGSTKGCSGVTACAHAEGLTPVGQRDFEVLLLAYLTRMLGPENQTSKKEELNKLISEFFMDGVFVHDRIPFREFVEDVADILEDMAEAEEDEEMEDEMEEFAREAMGKFMLPDHGGNENKRKESGRKRASG